MSEDIQKKCIIERTTLCETISFKMGDSQERDAYHGTESRRNDVNLSCTHAVADREADLFKLSKVCLKL